MWGVIAASLQGTGKRDMNLKAPVQGVECKTKDELMSAA